MNKSIMMNIEVMMNESLMNATKDVVYKVIMELSKMYDFDNEEACRNIGLSLSVKSSRSRVSKESKESKESKVSKSKCRFPLPYSGELDVLCCQGLSKNQGLYTQCKVKRMVSCLFCSSCQTSAECNNGVPEYGTIVERQKAYTEGIEFKDPSGKSPVAYGKIMKKLNVSREEVEEEASKLNMKINAIHFETDAVKKSGRPSKLEKKKPEGEVKAKGRPKKAKKVLELAGEEEDLFASLVMTANKQDDDSEDEVANTVIMSDSEDEEEEKLTAEMKSKMEEDAAKLTAEMKSKMEEDAAKLVAEMKSKQEAEEAGKLVAEEAAKINVAKEVEKIEVKKKMTEKKEAERLEKEAKKKAADEKKEAERLEKEAKKKAADEKKEAERLEKEAKKKAVEEEKSKKPKKEDKKSVTTGEDKKDAVAVVAVEESEEADVVRKFEFEGKKYLKSKKTGIIYNMEQDVIGKWNETKQRIDFDIIAEESCDEYEE